MTFEPLKVIAYGSTFISAFGSLAILKADEAEHVDLRRGNAVIAAHLSGRERLRAGVWRGNGTVTFNDTDRKVEYSHPVAIFCAFDVDRRMLRFDRDEIEGGMPGTTDANRGGTFIRTSEHVVNRRHGIHSATITGPEADVLDGIAPFDIRTAGSLNNSEIRIGVQFEKIFGPDGFVNNDMLVEAVDEGGGIFRLTWGMAEGRVRRTIWFDERAGMSPLRLEDRYRKKGGDPIRLLDPPEWSEPEDLVRVNWKEYDKVWVPISASFQKEVGLREEPFVARGRSVYEFTFDWSSVNTDPPEKLFTVDDLGADIVVVDRRLGGVPIIVKHPNVQDGGVLRRLETSAVSAGGKDELRATRSYARLWVIGAVNVAVAIVVIGLYLWVRRRFGSGA